MRRTAQQRKEPMKWTRRLALGAWVLAVGAVAIALDDALRRDLPIETGTHAGRGYFLVLLLVLMLPLARELWRDGRDWTTLSEPHRSRFRAVLFRYVAAIWVWAAVNIGVFTALAQDWVGLWTAMVAFATALGAMIVATIPFKRNMSALRDSDTRGPRSPRNVQL